MAIQAWVATPQELHGTQDLPHRSICYPILKLPAFLSTNALLIHKLPECKDSVCFIIVTLGLVHIGTQ